MLHHPLKITSYAQSTKRNLKMKMVRYIFLIVLQTLKTRTSLMSTLLCMILLLPMMTVIGGECIRRKRVECQRSSSKEGKTEYPKREELKKEEAL